jgi:NDP-mannose synthase
MKYNQKKLHAVILAGGKGTRLAPYTITLPKPLVPVGDKPILEIILKQLSDHNVKNIVIAVNHMAQLIEAFFGNGEKYGVNIKYSLEDKPLSTVAPIKLIDDLPDNFFVMNGDILTDIDYSDLFEKHILSGALLTVATYKRISHIDYGVIEIDNETKNIKGFHEKPDKEFNVSMGIYVFNKKVLDVVPYNQAYGFDDLVYKLLELNKDISTYEHNGYWLDIGRPEDYEKANNDVNNINKE